MAKEKLGCNVTYPEVKEEVGWQGMADGSIDTIVENWGHPDLVKKYIDDAGTVEDAGLTGNDGIIGWYVPPWMAEKYPDITDWENLNKYADMFKTSESGGKGQLLDGDPSYVTNDEALVKNLDLELPGRGRRQRGGAIQSFRSAEENKTPLLAYFYEPAVVLRRAGTWSATIDLPPYDRGLRRRPGQGRLRLPAVRAQQADLDEVRGLRLAGRGPDQELRAGPTRTRTWSRSTSPRTGWTPTTRPQKWIDDNPDKVDAWLQPDLGVA